MDRGTSDDAPPAPSPGVIRQRRANESPSRARRAPTIDSANRRASDVNTKAAKVIPPRRSSDVHEVPVSRRLDLDTADISVGGNRSARSKQSRVEAMNAIAASTMGSLNDLDGDANSVQDDVSGKEEGETKKIDHVVPRTPGKHRGALESFRRTRRASQEARRASLEAEAAAKEDAAASQDALAMSMSISKAETVGFGDRAEPGGALGAAWTPKKVEKEIEAAENEESSDSEEEELVTPSKKSSYSRFSHGRISIDKVEALTYSLGTRRRSRAGQDYSTIEPPNLSLSLSRSRSSRRASCTASPVVLSGSTLPMRSPLGTLDATNGNTGNAGMYKLRSSKSFAIDDDRLSWADMGDDDTDDFLTTK